jgi:hypothetical protein
MRIHAINFILELWIWIGAVREYRLWGWTWSLWPWCSALPLCGISVSHTMKWTKLNKRSKSGFAWFRAGNFLEWVDDAERGSGPLLMQFLSLNIIISLSGWEDNFQSQLAWNLFLFFKDNFQSQLAWNLNSYYLISWILNFNIYYI